MTEQEIEHRLSLAENSVAANSRRLDEVERKQEDITELVRSVSAIAQKQTDMDADMKEIKADVKAIGAKPARRWENLLEKAMLAVVAALVGWVMLRLGFGT